jgi:energy-coupling factor transporter ATP-binding protein EcfA2
MQTTSWKKCDLQVATPAWRFTLPSGSTHDFGREEDRQAFLDLYMNALKAQGIEVIALADHNTGAWIDSTKTAGARHGITVFPGCEITTSTGADGVHLLVIGDVDKSSQDFDRLIRAKLGFSDNEPFIDRGGKPEPVASSLTVEQILDALPDGYIAIAPHVFNDNGLASRRTVKGDIRWRCLHHERLSAVDAGDCSDIDGDGFNDRFCRRELSDFPCLQSLAFVSTSDAYDLESLGRRFTWIRMGTPNLEALRQAFLDHEARVLCDWSPRLADFPERNPNKIRHAWIENVSLGGTLGNSDAPLAIPLHPNLNVIIGGRGSGKSTVVAALRQLYEATDELPERIRQESESFADAVFSRAELAASHRLQESQQQQNLRWTKASGLEIDGSSSSRIDFPVRVISQKELFERAAGDKRDPFLASRNLLSMLDHSIGFDSVESQSIGGLSRRIEDAKSAWATAAKSYVELSADLAQLPSLREKAQTLKGQVDAFSAPEVRARLERIDAVRRDDVVLKNEEQRLITLLDQAEHLLVDTGESGLPTEDASTKEVDAALRALRSTTLKVRESLSEVVTTGRADHQTWLAGTEAASWRDTVNATMTDLSDYTASLTERGLSQGEFTRLQGELEQVERTVRILTEKEARLGPAKEQVTTAWAFIIELLAERRAAREEVLQHVAHRFDRLRFATQLFKDRIAWVEAIRDLAGFRSDAFLEDVPNLATWLWEAPEGELEQRWRHWRAALATGNFRSLAEGAKLKTPFANRLSGLDEAVRLRLATEIPKDVVHMDFLRPGGDPASAEDWQSITEGSPGQRTAAMLAFVLHHGIGPLVVDQPEDDLDSEWIFQLVVQALRNSRWHRQLIVVTHNANVPVLGDADQVIALENHRGTLRVRSSIDGDNEDIHIGPVEFKEIRSDIQSIMEGGVDAFAMRERRYNSQGRIGKPRGQSD